MDEVTTDIPMTLICSKAVEDIKDMLMKIMVEHNISADLMCMVLRDSLSHFERLRADDYVNALIRQSATIEQLNKENTSLKEASNLFNMEEENDTTGNQS